MLSGDGTDLLKSDYTDVTVQDITGRVRIQSHQHRVNTSVNWQLRWTVKCTRTHEAADVHVPRGWAARGT